MTTKEQRLRESVNRILASDDHSAVQQFFRALSTSIEEAPREGMTSSSHGDTIVLQPPPGRRRPRRSE